MQAKMILPVREVPLHPELLVSELLGPLYVKEDTLNRHVRFPCLLYAINHNLMLGRPMLRDVDLFEVTHSTQDGIHLNIIFVRFKLIDKLGAEGMRERIVKYEHVTFTKVGIEFHVIPLWF
jgi:hypothetical protein